MSAEVAAAPRGLADGGRRGRGEGRPQPGAHPYGAVRPHRHPGAAQLTRRGARRGPGRGHLLGRQAEVGENLPDDDRVLDGLTHVVSTSHSHTAGGRPCSAARRAATSISFVFRSRPRSRRRDCRSATCAARSRTTLAWTSSASQGRTAEPRARHVPRLACGRSSMNGRLGAARQRARESGPWAPRPLACFLLETTP